MSTLIRRHASTTLIHCSQCEGFGTYRATSLDATMWECDTCDHEISTRDIDLDPGERLTTAHITKGEVRLAWTTHATGCGTCGSLNDLHFHVRLGDDLPANLIPCPESE